MPWDGGVSEAPVGQPFNYIDVDQLRKLALQSAVNKLIEEEGGMLEDADSEWSGAVGNLRSTMVNRIDELDDNLTSLSGKNSNALTNLVIKFEKDIINFVIIWNFF